jgi:hypothetical protein
MNKSRKLMSLLLVFVLALPMVFMTVDALASETNYYNVVRTSGGRLNVWPRPVKEAGSSATSLANGTAVTLTGNRTYSTADKRWMVEISAPAKGWVDAKYIGKKGYAPPKKTPEPIDYWERAQLKGTAADSIINMWRDNEKPFERRYQKPVFTNVPLGYVFNGAIIYDNGTAWVEFVTADEEVIGGWVRTQWLDNLDVKGPVPAI